MMGSLTTLFVNKVNVQLKILANKINTTTLHPINEHLTNFFYHNQMHYNYKLDENIFKMLIQTNILSTDPNKKKKKLIIYYNKSKTSHLVINNNSSLLIGVLPRTSIVYQFKCHLGDCISEKNNMYIGLTSTTL